MQRHFEEELQELSQELLKMGGLCERMIHAAVRALLEHDMGHAGEVLRWEDEVNHLHVAIDERCMRILALQGPVASDLRAIIAALKINNDLERIGDQACNIMQNTVDLLKAPEAKLPADLPRMTELAMAMVREALDAYVKRSPDIAQGVLLKEDRVDAMKDDIFQEELALMSRDRANVARGLDMILIARNLEKVGDHATNIAEDVIFMVKAKDIRHHYSEQAFAQKPEI
jgi:phosphate transport system protein